MFDVTAAAAAQAVVLRQAAFLTGYEVQQGLNIMVTLARAGRTLEVNEATNAIAVGAGNGRGVGEFVILVEDGIDVIHEGDFFHISDALRWSLV